MGKKKKKEKKKKKWKMKESGKGWKGRIYKGKERYWVVKGRPMWKRRGSEGAYSSGIVFCQH